MCCTSGAFLHLEVLCAVAALLYALPGRLSFPWLLRKKLERKAGGR